MREEIDPALDRDILKVLAWAVEQFADVILLIRKGAAGCPEDQVLFRKTAAELYQTIRDACYELNIIRTRQPETTTGGDPHEP